jgi:hypothetical protein
LVFGARAVRAGAKREGYECVAGRCFFFQFFAFTKAHFETKYLWYLPLQLICSLHEESFFCHLQPLPFNLSSFYEPVASALMELKG